MYEFDVDYNTREVLFAGQRIPSFIGKKPLSVKNVARSSPFGVGEGSPKKVNQEFTAKWGITPSNFIRKFRGLWYGVNVAPVKEWVVKYAISSKRKIDHYRLETIWKRKSDIEQASDDGLKHLIPFIMYWDMEIHKAKKTVGKGLWKSLCKNSESRNKSIAKFVSVHQDREELKYLNDLPSTVLKRGRNLFHDPKIALVLSYHYKCKELASFGKVGRLDRDIGRLSSVVSDTISMGKRLNQNVDLKWSRRKWQEKHDHFTQEILEAEYSSDVFPCLSGFPESLQTVQYNNLIATLLDNPLAMKKESRLMKHCVGSYTDMVGRGDYLVYHIEDESEEEQTTVGIRGSQMHGWKVQQHYGACNSKECVTDEHVELAEKICKMLNEY